MPLVQDLDNSIIHSLRTVGPFPSFLYMKVIQILVPFAYGKSIFILCGYIHFINLSAVLKLSGPLVKNKDTRFWKKKELQIIIQ